MHFIIIGILIGVGLMLAPYVLAAVQLAIALPIVTVAARNHRQEKEAANPYARAEADIRTRGLNVPPW